MGTPKKGAPILKIRPVPKGKPVKTGAKLVSRRGISAEEMLAAGAPKGSLPERMVYGWLVKNHVSFAWQTSIDGGRVPGGQVLDFVLYDKAFPVVIRLQSYWHSGADKVLTDEVQLNILLQSGYIVEDVWEWEINTISKLDNKMRQILYGAPKFREVI
jgi:hypothetical protein